MGDIYSNDDYHIQCHVDGLNLRFAPGLPLEEMIRLQKEFNIFSDQHALQDSIALLNVTGASWELRRKWYELIKWIAELDSDQPKQKGGEAIIAALKTNLESPKALPVYFTSHDYAHEKRVLVNTKGKRPIFYIAQPYLTVSLPLRAKRKR